MRATYTVTEDASGDAVIREEDAGFNEPTVISRDWPLGIRASRLKSNWGDHKIGMRLTYLQDGCYKDPEGLVYRLENGGQTKCRNIVERPFPCPKVRKGVLTRYEYGSWFKHLKAEGWVGIA